MRFMVTDLQNNIIKEENDFTFELQDRPQCLERICTNIENFIASCGVERSKMLGLGVCMTGRVNPDTGRSYKYFTSNEQSLRDILEERIGLRVLIENDTRARCYAEYTCGKSKEESNVLYLHMGRGVAIGIVVDGKALLRQERLRRRVRPHPLLRQRNHLLVRQEGLPRNRGVGYRHRGQDAPHDRKGREHHPQETVRRTADRAHRRHHQRGDERRQPLDRTDRRGGRKRSARPSRSSSTRSTPRRSSSAATSRRRATT